MQQQTNRPKFWNYSFPVISILLGSFVGAYTFFHHSPSKDSQGYLGQQIFRPAFYGLTTTYVVLSVGLNLRLAKDRKSKQKKINF